MSARIPVQDLARARRWYSDKLGLDPDEERAGGLRYCLARCEFALSGSIGRADGSFTQLAFTVDDLREEVADLIERGAVFLDFDAGGISTRNGIAEIAENYPSRGTGELAAWLHDSEHNLIAIGSPIR